MRRRATNRRGATVLELSIILWVFLMVTSGILDLGIGVFRYHILAQAARQAARRAIVHGSNAAKLGPWGWTTIDVAASDNGTPIVDGTGDGIQSLLVGCDLANTRIKLEWLDGSNAPNKRVRATVATPYVPVTLLFLHPLTLQAASTMPIAH